MKNIYIFGASEYGKRAYHELKERYQVIHFVDNSKRKQGTEFIDGITVVSPEQIELGEGREIVIASSYAHEIIKQLEDIGIFQYNIFPSLQLCGEQSYKNKDLAVSIDNACMCLYQKYKSLDIETLSISDYSKRYLKNKSLTTLYQYGRILYYILEKKPDTEIFLEYGGGTGFISLLALELEIPHVYYNDIYDVSCRDAEIIATKMGYDRDGYIEGDVDKVYDFCAVHNMKFDAVGSYDVIEHIYQLDVFYQVLKKCLRREGVSCMESGANSFNPQIVSELIKGHVVSEFVDRERGFGWKERDASTAYISIREEMIRNYAEKSGQNISESELVALAYRTRGLIQADIENAVDRYLEKGELPLLDTYCPYNTCDPNTGNWCEHIVDFEKLKQKLDAMGLTTQIMFEGKPERSDIVRLLTTVTI